MYNEAIMSHPTNLLNQHQIFSYLGIDDQKCFGRQCHNDYPADLLFIRKGRVSKMVGRWVT